MSVSDQFLQDLIKSLVDEGKKPGILEENRLFFCVCVEDVSI